MRKSRVKIEVPENSFDNFDPFMQAQANPRRWRLATVADTGQFDFCRYAKIIIALVHRMLGKSINDKELCFRWMSDNACKKRVVRLTEKARTMLLQCCIQTFTTSLPSLLKHRYADVRALWMRRWPASDSDVKRRSAVRKKQHSLNYNNTLFVPIIQSNCLVNCCPRNWAGRWMAVSLMIQLA